jgi:hypothetical protein
MTASLLNLSKLLFHGSAQALIHLVVLALQSTAEVISHDVQPLQRRW